LKNIFLAHAAADSDFAQALGRLLEFGCDAVRLAESPETFGYARELAASGRNAERRRGGKLRARTDLDL
jgi:hypothetical protein